MQAMEIQLRRFLRKIFAAWLGTSFVTVWKIMCFLLPLSYEFLEAKLKTNIIIYLVKEISRQLNLTLITWLLVLCTPINKKGSRAKINKKLAVWKKKQPGNLILKSRLVLKEFRRSGQGLICIGIKVTSGQNVTPAQLINCEKKRQKDFPIPNK